jgi:hypothetical protein
VEPRRVDVDKALGDRIFEFRRGDVGALDAKLRRAHAADAIGKRRLREGGGEWESEEVSG